jgi:hypothetical protein
MRIDYQHEPHPHVVARKAIKPPKTADEAVGINGRIGLTLTAIVGTMWCAYAFAALAIAVLPQAIGGGLLTLVQWLSQTFIQLVMLSVIMVGQNLLGLAADKRSELTYKDADATLHEAEQIQGHLKVQDEAMNEMLAKIEKLEAALAAR